MRRRVGSVFGAALFIGATVLAAATPVAAHDSDGRASVIKSGLSSPKGIALLTRNSIVVGQGGYGPPAAPAFEYAFRGPHKGTFTDLTDPVSVVDVAVTPDGAGWAIGTDQKLYRQGSDGVIKEILDIAAYQKADPDPYNNPVEDPAETNPFGLAALKSNDVLLADAAGNDIIRVKADGTAWTVARFPRRLVKTDKVGDPKLPAKLPAEAVPTSIAIGADGWAYVGQLVGFPGRPGAAYVWKVNPNAKGALCVAGHANRWCRTWKGGFTAIMDLAFDPRNGTLYVYELARGGFLAFEAGFQPGGTFPKAVLLQVPRHGDRRELVRGDLSQPGGVVVGRGGEVFVTDGMFTGGRLLRIRP
jgi:hypothetical protein